MGDAFTDVISRLWDATGSQDDQAEGLLEVDDLSRHAVRALLAKHLVDMYATSPPVAGGVAVRPTSFRKRNRWRRRRSRLNG